MQTQIGKAGMGLAGDGGRGTDMFPLGIQGISLTPQAKPECLSFEALLTNLHTTAFQLFCDLLPTDTETCICCKKLSLTT